MNQRRMSDQELQERLEQALNEFPSLKNSAPDNWMVKAQVTVDKLMHFANTRKDHFRINLPLALWNIYNPSATKEAKGICRGILRKFDIFTEKYSDLNSAKRKASEVFNAD